MATFTRPTAKLPFNPVQLKPVRTFPKNSNSYEEDTDIESKPNYKTIMCRYGKNCIFGDRCSFAHSESELRSFNNGRPFVTPNTVAAVIPEPPPVNLPPPKPFVMQVEDFPQLSNKQASSKETLKDQKDESDKGSIDDFGSPSFSRAHSSSSPPALSLIDQVNSLASINVPENIGNNDDANVGNGNEWINGSSLLAPNFGYLSAPLQVQPAGQQQISMDSATTDSYFSSLLTNLTMDHNINNSLGQSLGISHDTGLVHDSNIFSMTNLSNESKEKSQDNSFFHFPSTSNSASMTSPAQGIDSDEVPPKTFPTVEWLRSHNMAVYLWAGNDRAWTEFALHVTNFYVQQLANVLPEIMRRTGCQMWIDHDYLGGSYESFLVMRRGESGDPANMAMTRALEAVSAFFAEVFYPKHLADGNSALGRVPVMSMNGMGSLPFNL